MAEDEFVAEWFRFANMDLDTAKHTFETMRPAPLEIICYHCQQAAEKFLKGVLVSFDVEPEKTHDIAKLTAKLKNYLSVPDEFALFERTLTQYGVRTRYPTAISVDEEQTKSAIAHAEKVKQWAESVITKIAEAEKNAEEEKDLEQGNSKK